MHGESIWYLIAPIYHAVEQRERDKKQKKKVYSQVNWIDMVNDRAGKHNTCKFFEWNYSKSFFYGGLKDNNRLQKKKKRNKPHQNKPNTVYWEDVHQTYTDVLFNMCFSVVKNNTLKY